MAGFSSNKHQINTKTQFADISEQTNNPHKPSVHAGLGVVGVNGLGPLDPCVLQRRAESQYIKERKAQQAACEMP